MVWIFGDSFSAPFDSKGMGPWANQYITWKGYVPNNFGDIISNKFNQELKNLAVGGLDNDSIFETILNNSPLIQKEDIVIIGWSSIQRFRLSSTGKPFTTYLPNFDNEIKNPYISKNTVEEIFVNRTGVAYMEEFKNRITFLNWLFEDNILIQWSPFRTKYLMLPEIYNTVTKETGGQLDDGHYSELGHQQISEYFLTLIGDDRLRERNNTIPNNII